MDPLPLKGEGQAWRNGKSVQVREKGFEGCEEGPMGKDADAFVHFELSLQSEWRKKRL